MKLVSFEVRTPMGPVRRIGVVIDDEITNMAVFADLNTGYAAFLAESGETRAQEAAAVLMPPDMIGYLEGGESSNARAKQVLDFVKLRPDAKGPAGETVLYSRSQVKLLSPLPRPRTLRDFSTYEEHMSTSMPVKRPGWYYAAACYRGNPDSVYGTDDPIIYPPFTKWLDPELEIGAVINKQGRNIKIEDAKAYIGGYTIFCDISARDMGGRDTLGPYKMKDFCTILGPCIATADSFDEENSRCYTKVNGEVWYEGNTGSKRHYFSPELVAYASDCETIHPGDVLGSGTVGFGCSMDLHKWLKPGDIVEQWIEGIGAIKTTVVKEDNPDSYVLNGLPGRLPIPEYAAGFMEEMQKRQAEAEARGYPTLGI